MTNAKGTATRRKGGGLGNLLQTRPTEDTTGPQASAQAPADTPAPDAAPAAPAPAQEPAPAEPAGPEWVATLDKDGAVLGRVHAANEHQAVKAVTEQTGRRSGFSVIRADQVRQRPAVRQPGTPAMLPRRRASRVAKDKLTVQIPVHVLDALDYLTDRDSSRKYDEVEAALRAHLAAKGIPVQED